MRQHDSKHTYSHSAIRQRPGNSYGDSSEHNNYHYHHSNHYRTNSHGTNINGYYTSGAIDNNSNNAGGMASALSGGEHHESEKQWTWLEAVLAKSKQNKETVSKKLRNMFAIQIIMQMGRGKTNWPRESLLQIM